MSKKEVLVGLQVEHGQAYGCTGSWVIRVHNTLVWSMRTDVCSREQAYETANAVFNALALSEACPRWAYHPAF